MNRIVITLGVLVCVFGSLASAFAGEVRGRILITKNLTKRRLVLPDYQLRGVAISSNPAERGSTDKTTSEFSRVVVYLDGPAVPSEHVSSETLSQKNTFFDPEILVVPVGSTVSFPNEDPIFHNVFSLSKAKEFDLGYYPAGQTRTLKFDRVGVVQVYCHIHRDMSAAILVVPNQSFVRPANDGNFSLEGIPAGTQYVVVWHKSAGFFRKRIEVPASGAVSVSFTIPVPSTE
jgi:plastocyanin